MEKVRLAAGLIMPILAGGFLDGGNDVMAVLSIVLFGVLLYPYMEWHKGRVRWSSIFVTPILKNCYL